MTEDVFLSRLNLLQSFFILGERDQQENYKSGKRFVVGTGGAPKTEREGRLTDFQFRYRDRLHERRN